MRVAQLDLADPEFPVSLVEKDDPVLPDEGWARVQVTGGGICGSDLHLLFPGAPSSPVFGPYAAFPMELGHELGGVVVEVGTACPVPVGSRVAVDPTIACEARGLELCARCAEGARSACLRLSERVVTPGMGIGFTSGLGAGWGDQVVVHHSQLHVVPDGLETAAIPLTEPLSIVVHGLLRRPPADGAPVLVIGAGVIGLAAVAAARALLPASEVTIIARHPHQAAAARAIGAHHVVTDGDGVLEELASISGATLTGERRGAMLAGGYPVVIEAVGSAAALALALKATAQRGAVHLVGAIGRADVDLTPLWFKELDVIGTFCHAVDDGEHSFDRAIEMLAGGLLPAATVITHTFPLADVRHAAETANARDQGAIKVQLVP
jgi:threonine dehydrogenase-like Zn-dependent dehydrogenase